MLTVLTIGGTSYTASQRAHSRLKMDDLTRTIESGYDTAEFHEDGFLAVPIFHRAQAVVITIDGTTRFQGEITDIDSRPSELGWCHAYRAEGLLYQADRVPVTAVDLSGTQLYNRSPEDPYFNPSDAGLTLGQMFTRILTIPQTAAALSALGVGQYTSLGPPTLPAATVSDFSVLNVVPPSTVEFGGESIFATMSQLLQRYMPKYLFEITPDGFVRVKNTQDLAVFVPRTLTVAGPGGAGDPCLWPNYRSSTRDCYTRMVVRGQAIVEPAVLSTKDHTLKPAWSSMNQSAWTLHDFTEPKDAMDTGSISAMTSNTATISSDVGATTWIANFWSVKEAWIVMRNDLASGIAQIESRLITANTSMSAGGSSIVTWDASWPVSNTAYTKYRIVGTMSDLAEVGRLFDVEDAATGDTALNTYIGSHLVVRSPKVVRYANIDGTFGTYYPVGTICWSSSGNPPYVEYPAAIQALPSTGQFNFVAPVVKPFGQTARLNEGYPTTYPEGLPGDVRVLALYSRGALSATIPPDISGVPQYEGTAFSSDGLEVTKYIEVNNWIWQNDTASMTLLGQQHLDTLKNTIYEGVLDYLVVQGTVPGWDYLSFVNSLNIAINGATSPLSAVNAPIKTVRVRWNKSSENPWTHLISLGFSNRQRPFSGDDLYLHPQFAEGTPLAALQGDRGGGFFWGQQTSNPYRNEANEAIRGGRANVSDAMTGGTAARQQAAAMAAPDVMGNAEGGANAFWKPQLAGLNAQASAAPRAMAGTQQGRGQINAGMGLDASLAAPLAPGHRTKHPQVVRPDVEGGHTLDRGEYGAPPADRSHFDEATAAHDARIARENREQHSDLPNTSFSGAHQGVSGLPRSADPHRMDEANAARADRESREQAETDAMNERARVRESEEDPDRGRF